MTATTDPVNLSLDQALQFEAARLRLADERTVPPATNGHAPPLQNCVAPYVDVSQLACAELMQRLGPADGELRRRIEGLLNLAGPAMAEPLRTAHEQLSARAFEVYGRLANVAGAARDSRQEAESWAAVVGLVRTITTADPATDPGELEALVLPADQLPSTAVAEVLDLWLDRRRAREVATELFAEVATLPDLRAELAGVQAELGYWKDALADQLDKRSAERPDEILASVNQSAEHYRDVAAAKTREAPPVPLFEFVTSDGGGLTLEGILGQVVGAASMTWGDPPSGVFNDAKACAIVDVAAAAIRSTVGDSTGPAF